VPEENRLEHAKDFASGTKETLLHSRISVAWVATGMAAGAFEAAMKYTRERIQFKKPVAQFQLIQSKLVKMLALVQSALLLVVRISQLYDQGKATIGKIAMTKAECTVIAR